MKTRLILIAALLASPLAHAQGAPGAMPGPGMQAPGMHAQGGDRHGAHGMRHGGPLMGADANKDGAVSRDEALTLFNARFNRLDANKDGKITPEEMRAAHEAHRKEHEGRRQAALDDRFKKADANSDGALSRDEATTAMPRLVHHFERIDANKDGKLSKEELQQARPARHRHGGMSHDGGMRGRM